MQAESSAGCEMWVSTSCDISPAGHLRQPLQQSGPWAGVGPRTGPREEAQHAGILISSYFYTLVVTGGKTFFFVSYTNKGLSKYYAIHFKDILDQAVVL